MPEGVEEEPQTPAVHVNDLHSVLTPQSEAVVQPPAGSTQIPATQALPAPQTRPQAPQLLTFVERSAHAPPQFTWPAAQAQLPPMQAAPAPHARPQAPQLDGSLDRSVQAPPHDVSPGRQGRTTHCPPVHMDPGWQA